MSKSKTDGEAIKKLGNNESYKCPFPHPNPRQDMAFFRDFDAHFRVFKDRDDHLELLQLHEELLWKLRCSELEKRTVTQDILHELSLKAWFEAVKKKMGKPVQIVQKR